ncbi:hypothetical protein FJZ27_01085 [Candidatus Peribacteria bacterium]|nr:hypothetical protein [Candidatus Peribacteria bacterium]
MQLIPQTPQAIALRDPLAEYAKSFISNQSCENSKQTYAQEISLFYRKIRKRADEVTLHDLLNYKESLTVRGLKAATIAKKLTVLRRLFTFLYEQGVIPTNPSAGIKLPKVSNETVRGILTLAECNQFLSSIDASTNLGKRDKAICALLLINGIRLCEVARANIGDLSEVNGLKVLRIRGKGGKNIDTRMRDDVYAVIQSYLKTRSSLKTSDPLFIGTNHTAKDRIARRTIQHMVRLRLKRIGINRPNISVHSLRHSSITHLINGGASLIAAADFARHSNPNTTQRYFHNLERLKNSAVMLQPIRVD